MKFSIINFSQTIKYNTFNADFNIVIKNIEDNYKNFINQFNCKCFPFFEKFKLCKSFEGEAIEIKANFSDISVKIVNEPKDNKLLVIYIVPNENNKEISMEQLYWFLNNNEILNYFKVYISGGTFIPRLNKEVFKYISVPISNSSFSKRNFHQIDLTQFNAYKNLLKKYYEEYRTSYKNKNFMACTTLAGSICELILYQLLIEQPKVTNDYVKEVGLGTLIKYVKMMDLEKRFKFPINAFEEINKIRNKIIHPSNTIKEDIENIEIIIDPLKLDEFLKKILIVFGIN